MKKTFFTGLLALLAYAFCAHAALAAPEMVVSPPVQIITTNETSIATLKVAVPSEETRKVDKELSIYKILLGRFGFLVVSGEIENYIPFPPIVPEAPKLPTGFNPPNGTDEPSGHNFHSKNFAR